MTMYLRAPILCTPLIFLALSQAQAANFFVSPSVVGLNGDGSFQAPWSLTAALAHPAAVKPGDTIWLRGGVYYGLFTSKLQGTQGAPIIVRQYPGEKAILDQNDSRNGAILRVEGGSTWFWGFEITNSNPMRTLTIPGSNPDERRANSIDVYGDGVKLINLIIHDTGQGPGMWTQAENTEAYGCIIYNNGWVGPDRGHGHGFYTQNRYGLKLFRDNIVFNQFGNRITVYGSSASFTEGFLFEGNVSFNERTLIGGGGPTGNITLRNNYFYNGGVEFGYDSRDNKGLQLEDNWFAEGINIKWWKDVNVRNNVILTSSPDGGSKAVGIMYNQAADASTFRFNQNRYAQRSASTYEFWTTSPENGGVIYQFPAWQGLGFDVDGSVPWIGKPTGTQVYVRRNFYDPGRFHIIVYNWDEKPTVSLNPGVFHLEAEETLEIRNVQNPQELFTWSISERARLLLPMNGWSVAAPIGTDGPLAPSTFPRFGVFVATKKAPQAGSLPLIQLGQ